MFVYWLMLVLQKGNRCSLFFLKRHLPSSSFYESRRRQPSIPTAQARLQGLQADPRRLANAHAAHKTPGKTSASTAVRRLALWGRAVSEDCQAASAALLHPVNPLPSITRSARLNKQRSGDLSLHSPENFGDSAILPKAKSLHLLSKFSPPEVIRLQLVYAPHPTGEVIAFATTVRSGPSALRGPLDSSYAGI